MKHVQAFLSARKDGERSFLHCGSPVKLEQPCLCVGSTLQRRRGGAVKLVPTCLCAGNILKTRFKRGGGAVKHVQAFIKLQKRWRKLFSPLWSSCEAGANLFICGKHPMTPFSPTGRCCKTRAGLFKCHAVKIEKAVFSTVEVL